jgi:excisionase family DNA binding protein
MEDTSGVFFLAERQFPALCLTVEQDHETRDSEALMFTVADVAGRWNCSPQLIYALVAEGKLECFRLGNGRGTIRFTEEQLQAFLASARIKPRVSVPVGLKHLTIE